ncbi:hypothetical protein LTR22_005216 [Elasticomyces elasticus]|nr:hypothetical protein LTR22_005216 [Elasticomyces elasticus]
MVFDEALAETGEIWTPDQFVERLHGLSAGYEDDQYCSEAERMWAPMHDGCVFEEFGTFDPQVQLEQPEWQSLYPLRLQEDVDGFVEATGRKDSAVDLGPWASGLRSPRGQDFPTTHQPWDVWTPTLPNGGVREWPEAQCGQGVQSSPSPVLTEHEMLGYGAPTLIPEPEALPDYEPRCDFPDDHYLIACAVEAVVERPAPVCPMVGKLGVVLDEWKGLGLDERRVMEDAGVALFEAEMTPPPPMRVLRGVGQEGVEPDVCTYTPQQVFGVENGMSVSAPRTWVDVAQQRLQKPPGVIKWNGRPAVRPRAGLGKRCGMTPEEFVVHRRKGKNESQRRIRAEQKERERRG